jgi:5'-nucleotidase (lipoprotein e(P4) family)
MKPDWRGLAASMVLLLGGCAGAALAPPPAGGATAAATTDAAPPPPSLPASAVGAATGQADAPQAVAGDTGREQLQALLWMQAAAEYRAIAEQTWRLATERLPSLLQPGSASLEQWEMDPLRLGSLPTAVIVDLDETVLDNSFYQARLARARRDYDDESWDAWIEEAAATAVPGAREFLQAAARAGHRVFYVTNRECRPAGTDPCPQKAATQRNLLALDLPSAGDPGSLLLRRERPEWSSSDKTVRRAWLGERYRIVALGGDDLRDFVDRPVYDARRAELSPLFGTRWFLLPNPIYGSWDREIAGPACASQLSRDECARSVLERRYQRIEVDPLPLSLPGVRAWGPDRDRLRLATWNVEYLVEPATYAALAGSCVADGGKVPGALRRIPCAIVPRLARDEADFATLRRYAAQLDADVVALQEVDGPGAASRLLPGYDYCFTARQNVQKNGFAIRRGLPHRCEPEYLPVSLDDRFRRGVVVTLFPGEARELTVMNVHLKSGCPEGPLSDAAQADCASLAAQVPPLKDWIDAQARAGNRFAIAGDFNRRLAREQGPARDGEGRIRNLWAEIAARDPPAAGLVRVSERLPFRKCISNDPYTSYIDDIVLSRDLARRLRPGDYVRVTYSDVDARERRLSDHCPVGVDLALR